MTQMNWYRIEGRWYHICATNDKVYVDGSTVTPEGIMALLVRLVCCLF